MLKPFSFVVMGQPATKKNSAIKTRFGIIPSKAFRAYEKDFRKVMMILKTLKELPHYECPVNVKALYYLRNAAHFPDLLGLEQATADIMSDEYRIINHKRTRAVEWILCDDRIIKSWDGSRIAGIDKDNPRVEVEITPMEIDVKTEIDPMLLKIVSKRKNIAT